MENLIRTNVLEKLYRKFLVKLIYRRAGVIHIRNDNYLFVLQMRVKMTTNTALNILLSELKQTFKFWLVDEQHFVV